MRPILWVLILAPPCAALVAWLKPRSDLGARRVPTYTFWVVLAIAYVVAFATALVEHKL
jgi:Fe2+ transport system protein B